MTIKPFTRSFRHNDPGASVDYQMLWRDMSALSKLWFFALALQELGSPLIFTLFLTGSTKVMMERSHLSPKEFISRRFRGNLPGVPCFFVLEFTKTGAVHIHGAMAISMTERHYFDAKLRKVSGDCRKIKTIKDGKFSDFNGLISKEPNQNQNNGGRNGFFGWANYCAKHVKRTRRLIDQSPIACSRNLSQHARKIHAEIAQFKLLPDQVQRSKS